MSEMRQYLTDFMSRRELSLSRLAEILGYKSKTSLVRLMEDSSREKSVLAFAEAMRSAFELTGEEHRELVRAVTISVHGRAKYLAEREMWRFVQGVMEQEKVELDIRDAETGEMIDLESRYGSACEVHITLVNCHGAGIFPLLKRLLGSGRATVDQFIYADGNDAKSICAVNALMSIFYEKGYNGYACMRSEYDEATEPLGTMRADVMAVGYVLPDGERAEDVIVFSARGRGVLTAHRGYRQSFMELLGLRREVYAPIKRSYFQCSALENYIQFSADYSELEHNRGVWKIKPDIGVDWIPVSILAAALREGPAGEALDEETFAALYEVYERRVENTFTKRKPAYTLMKRSAMRRFMATGRTSDHFWGMRAYTPEERAAILAELIYQQQNNPYFHIYFLKDDQAIRDAEIAYYEDMGILILEADTDYDLAGGHSEIMLTHPELMRLFRDFFMNDLLKQYALPEEETLSFLASCACIQ